MKPNSSGNKGTNFSIYTKNLPNKKNLLDRLIIAFLYLHNILDAHILNLL